MKFVLLNDMTAFVMLTGCKSEADKCVDAYKNLCDQSNNDCKQGMEVTFRMQCTKAASGKDLLNLITIKAASGK
jgi:hypothetical protein